MPKLKVNRNRERGTIMLRQWKTKGDGSSLCLRELTQAAITLDITVHCDNKRTVLKVSG